MLNRLFVLTFMSFFFSTVHADITQRYYGDDKYTAGGFKYVVTTCDVAGIAKDYANTGFIKGFLPADKQAGLKSVTWDPKTRKMAVAAKENYTLACQEKSDAASVSLTCSFDPIPKGVKYLWFKITRTKDGVLCQESAKSEGQFSGLVRVKGYSPAGLHEQVAKAFTSPYAGGNGRAIAQAAADKKHAVGKVVKAPVTDSKGTQAAVVIK